jgi:hypothetical protein
MAFFTILFDAPHELFSIVKGSLQREIFSLVFSRIVTTNYILKHFVYWFKFKEKTNNDTECKK